MSGDKPITYMLHRQAKLIDDLKALMDCWTTATAQSQARIEELEGRIEELEAEVKLERANRPAARRGRRTAR